MRKSAKERSTFRDFVSFRCSAGSGANWLADGAFTPVVTEEAIIGRGTQDDKGPTIAALYGVKALLDAQVTFNQRVRFIFGCDEENLWRCINRYNEKEEMITAGFVLDSKFL